MTGVTQTLYERNPRRYFLSWGLIVAAGVAAIELLFGILGSRTFGLSPSEAVAPVLVMTLAGIPTAALALWITRRNVRALVAWPDHGSDGRSREEMARVAFAAPLRGVGAGLVGGLLIVIPASLITFEIAGAFTGDRAGDHLALFFGGSLFGLLYAAAYIYCCVELALRPVRRDLGRGLSRSDLGRTYVSSLIGRVVIALLVSSLVLGFCAGVLIAPPDSTFSEGFRIAGIAILAAAVIGASLTIPASRSALDPIDDLIEGTRAIASGDLDARVPVTSVDELGELTDSFNRMVADLQRGSLELQASRARLVAASDEARRRVEREVHDGVQQSLVLVNLKLGVARAKLADDPDAAERLLAEAATEAERALGELRDLARGIYPQLLTSDGLPGALAEATERSTIPATFMPDGAGRYPIEVEAAVHFCCLEALHNAAKHAGEGATVKVSLEERGGELRFEVADDGAGFDPAGAGGSAGLQNMADRIRALGGELKIDSAPGRGTRVSGSVPV